MAILFLGAVPTGKTLCFYKPLNAVMTFDDVSPMRVMLG